LFLLIFAGAFFKAQVAPKQVWNLRRQRLAKMPGTTGGRKRPSLGGGGAPIAKKRSLEDFFGNPADGPLDIPQEAQMAVTAMGEWLYAPQDNHLLTKF